MIDTLLLYITNSLIYLIEAYNVFIPNILSKKILQINYDIKIVLANRLFLYYNSVIFDNKLSDCCVIMNKRLKVTAGQCRYLEKNVCQIELSPIVCTNKKIIQNILLHEMCHAAVMIIDNDLNHLHGKKFKLWGNIVENLCGEKITTYHNFAVNRNFKYKCNFCDNIKKVYNRNHLVNNSKCYSCNRGVYCED